MTALDAANAAPLASDIERSGFKTVMVYIFVALFGVFAACVAGAHFYMQHQTHAAKVAAIQSAPVVLPEPVNLGYGKSHIPKIKPQNATNKIATQSINTTDVTNFEAAKPVVKESSADDPLAPALAEFNQRVTNLESKL